MKIKNFASSTLDVSLSLNNEFKNKDENTLMLLSPWANKSLDFNNLKDVYKVDKICIFNLEPYNSKFFNNKDFTYYIDMLQHADEVWDYDEDNIQSYKHYLSSNIKQHTIKSFVSIPTEKKEYDVCFYGLMNKHRALIINQLYKYNIKVCSPYLCYGDDLNEYIAKSKILLNIHFHDTSLLEQARLCRWLNNGEIISEKSKHNYMNVPEYDYNELVNVIREKIKK